MKKIFAYIFIGIVFASIGFVLMQPKEKSFAEAIEVKMWHSPTCGCCERYEPYLERAGFEVKSIEIKDVDSIKNSFKIPQELRSCHTIYVDGYIVEGHVPEKAIKKLLEERPDIKGITVPGMPQEAPGMATVPGIVKVYSFDEEGNVELFYEGK